MTKVLLEIGKLNKRVEFLERENMELRQRVKELEQENELLREKLHKYETPKNSNNSSIPPSKDENRPLKTKSLREKTNRNVGGQKGREGNTLKMSDSPDEIIEHIPGFCGCCGNDLSHVPYGFIGKRQVIDIPIIQPKVWEYRIYERKCSCGQSTQSSYPKGVNASVSYGRNTESLIGYFHSRQHIPFKRMQELLNEVLHLPISEGGIHELLNRLSDKATSAYEIIRERITNAKTVGADETGMKINGKKGWFWTWQNNEITFIAPSENRGFATIETNFKNGFKNGVLTHDCWKSHFMTPAKNHQICTAHLLRELNYFIEAYKNEWSVKFRKLLLDAIGVEREMEKLDYYKTHPPRDEIIKRLNDLLTELNENDHSEVKTFQTRMTKYKDYLFNFLYYPDVPPDNNGSERAIRNVKLKQKISGQFKSLDGAMRFAKLRSVTDTAIKNGKSIIDALFAIAEMEVTD